MTTPITPEFLLRYCAPDDSNEVLRKPWTRDGVTCASDRRIFIEVPAIPGVAEHPKPPLAVMQMWRDGNWVVPPEPISVPCVNCRATGICECLACKKNHQCWVCRGTGKEYAQRTWNGFAGSHGLASHYLDLARQLPNAMICAGEHPDSPVSIKFDGGRGLLMPMQGQ